jgi:hypothetical protein
MNLYNVKHKSGYFIDCEKSQSDELFKQLSIYKIKIKSRNFKFK